MKDCKVSTAEMQSSMLITAVFHPLEILDTITRMNINNDHGCTKLGALLSVFFNGVFLCMAIAEFSIQCVEDIDVDNTLHSRALGISFILVCTCVTIDLCAIPIHLLTPAPYPGPAPSDGDDAKQAAPTQGKAGKYESLATLDPNELSHT